MKTVLLIDDEPGLARLVEMSIQRPDLPVGVDWADDLATALEVSGRRRPDVVLLDLTLREEDGLAILPRLREEPSLQGVPVVVFTVHDSRRDEAIGLGADGFLTKPFRQSELEEALRPFLSG
ncbi:MAG: response regulator [Actinomycetota bacterium]